MDKDKHVGTPCGGVTPCHRFPSKKPLGPFDFVEVFGGFIFDRKEPRKR